LFILKSNIRERGSFWRDLYVVIFYNILFILDNIFVLAYLRARRYVMSKAKELYERSCLFIKQNPEICVISDESFARVLEVYDSGAIIVMKERDALGRRIVLCVTRKFDTSKHTIDDTMRLFSIVSYNLLFEEDTQKNGIVFINDLSGLSISHVKLFPYKMLKNYSSYMNVSALRVKEIYVVGMPSIAVQLFKAIHYVLDDKNKNRLQVMSDVSKLWNFVDQNIMTKEFGGKSYCESEALTDFKKCIIEHKEILMEYTNNLDIDMEKAKKFHKVKGNRSKNTKNADRLLEFD